MNRSLFPLELMSQERFRLLEVMSTNLMSSFIRYHSRLGTKLTDIYIYIYKNWLCFRGDVISNYRKLLRICKMNFEYGDASTIMTKKNCIFKIFSYISSYDHTCTIIHGLGCCNFRVSQLPNGLCSKPTKGNQQTPNTDNTPGDSSKRCARKYEYTDATRSKRLGCWVLG